MKPLKIFYIIPILFFALTISGNAYPTRLTAGTETELKVQLSDEIVDVLQTRFLRYASEHLDGEVLIEATVQSDGRIVFKGINCKDDDLRNNVFCKLCSLNLWTYPDFANTLFRYKVIYKD
jgi:hypothetical protein